MGRGASGIAGRRYGAAYVDRVRRQLAQRLRRPVLPAQPVSRRWGLDRGTAVDRQYIDAFLARQAADIRGRVLEVMDDGYTRRLGGAGVTRSDVLDVMPGPGVTVVGDLGTGEGLPRGAFDCFICTQTLHLVPDLPAACRHAVELLVPGGVLLATFPVLSPIARPDDGGDAWADHWRLTAAGARALFAPVVGDGQLEVREHGNVRTAAAFLYGLAVEDLDASDFHTDDADVPLVVTVRATAA